MLGGNGKMALTRRPTVLRRSRHRLRRSGEQVVGGAFDFEAVQAESRDHDAPAHDVVAATASTRCRVASTSSS